MLSFAGSSTVLYCCAFSIFMKCAMCWAFEAKQLKSMKQADTRRILILAFISLQAQAAGVI